MGVCGIREVHSLILRILPFNRVRMIMKYTLALVLDFVPDGDRSMEEFILGLSEKMLSDGWSLVHVYTGEPGPIFHQRLSEMNIPYIVAPKSLNLLNASR